MNPKHWKTFQYSSLQHYFGKNSPEYLVAGRVEELFIDREQYMQFLEEYIEQKQLIDETKYELTDFY